MRLVLLATLTAAVSGCDGELLCTGIARPMLSATVIDASGRSSAIGAVLHASNESFDASWEGFGDARTITTTDPPGRGGTYRLEVSRPWHRPAVIDELRIREGRCGVESPAEAEFVIDLLPGAPPIRNLVLPTYGYGFGDGNWEAVIPHFIERDAGVAVALAWASSDTTTVRVDQAGRITTVCRGASGSSWISAHVVSDPAIRDSVAVFVAASPPGSTRCP